MRGLIYRDRQEAGQRLAEMLAHHAGTAGLLVLGLPRGGVPVAYEVAKSLDAPMDVLVVRKLGVPGHEELAMGAIASGGARFVNERIVQELRIREREIERTEAEQREELHRREHLYRGREEAPRVQGRLLILVDDGLATGATMKVAVAALGPLEPARIVVAVPVAPRDAVEALRALVDEVVCPYMPEPFAGVGQWYEHFEQTTDEQVRDLLSRRRSERREAAS